MCFGETWTLVSLTALSATSVASIAARLDWRITAALLFVATKELIQYLLYRSLVDTTSAAVCTPSNRALTTLSWVHVSFQPLVVNLFVQAFSATPTEYAVPLIMCVVFAVANLLRLFLSSASSSVRQCRETALCGKKTCSVLGEKHVAYRFKLASADAYAWVPSWFAYMLLTFVPAFAIGDYSIATIHAIVFLASFAYFQDEGEAAAVWCVNSFWFVGFACARMLGYM